MAAMQEPITTPKPAKPLPAPNADFYEFARTLSGIRVRRPSCRQPLGTRGFAVRRLRWNGRQKARNIRLPSEASTAIPRPVKKSKSHREDVMATDHS